MKDKKIKTIVGIVVLLLIVIGATYAYFIAQIGSGASTNVTIEADTVDSLQFTTSGELGIKLNQDNFASGKGNQKGSTTATATLIAGTNRNPSYTYNIYLAISLNEFIYTTSDKKPELILRVTNSSNEALTTLEGLTYNESLSGFDITEESGVITLASNYEITTTSTLRQNWKVEVEVINLDSDQSENAGRRLDAELIIQQDTLANTLADVCTNGDDLADCIKTLEEKSTYSVSRILHHDDTLANGANDNSYRYSGGDYILTNKSKLAGYKNIEDDLIISYCKDEESPIVNNCRYTRTYALRNNPTNVYTKYKEALDVAKSSEYLIDNNIKNYVCFGSNEANCPEDNLYRIIGVFENQVKLIKADFIKNDKLGTNGDYFGVFNEELDLEDYTDYLGNLENIRLFYWNNNQTEPKQLTGETNVWHYSHLNNINLNTNFLNNFENDWSQKISFHNWLVYGGDYNEISSMSYKKVKNAYDYEIGEYNPKDITYFLPENKKIGLMYTTDYYYAASPQNWESVYYYPVKVKESDWLYARLDEWTISRRIIGNSFGSDMVFCIGKNGNVNIKASYYSMPVRPTFYLNANIKYKSGTGTIVDPYRIQ